MKLSDLGFKLPLSEAAFRHASQAGLGRAILHLRSYGAVGMESSIFEVCTRDPAYDPQCEPNREAWVLNLIDEAGLAAGAAVHVRGALATASETWHLDHVSSLAVGLIRRGFNELRAPLYEAFDSHRTREEWAVGRQIIELDGADGLLHVARGVGARLRADPAYWIDAYLPMVAADTIGADPAARILDMAAQSDADIQAFVKAAKAEPDISTNVNSLPATTELKGREWREARNKKLAAIPFVDIERDIDAPGSAALAHFGNLRQWGEAAPESELLRASDAITEDRDARTLARLFAIFNKRGVPGFEPRLLQFLVHPDQTVRHRAHFALGATRHPAIRAEALAQTRAGVLNELTLRLYVSNVEPGDGVAILDSLPSDGDTDFIHSLVHDITHIWDQQAYPDAAGPLIWAYDRSPCSNCRFAVCKTLVSMNALPDWAAEEAPFDCDEDIGKCVADGRHKRG